MHDFRGTKILVNTATTNEEATNLGQVKDLINKYIKEPVLVATTGELTGTYTTGTLTLDSPLTEIDDISLNPKDRILLKDQVDSTKNGIYEYVDSTTLKRTEDFAEGSVVMNNTIIKVMQGTINADTKYMLVSDGVLTVNTSNLIFVKDSGESSGIKLAQKNIVGDDVKTEFEIPHNFDLSDSLAYSLVLKDAAGNKIYCDDKPTLGNEANSITCKFSNAIPTGTTYKAFVIGLE